MNTIRTVIIRLLVNLDEPGQLRGDLQILPENSLYAFKGEEDLSILLHQVAGSSQQPQNLPETKKPPE